MKNKMIAAAILFAAFATTNANSQATAFASTTAILVTPIAVTKTFDMHFGTLAASPIAGTATLNYANGVTPALGVSVIDATLATTAVFTVAGAASESISVTIPSAAITLTSGLNTMTVDGFTCDAGGTTTLSGAGAATLKVLGVLHVAANQLAGTYSNNLANVATSLFVTVNYN